MSAAATTAGGLARTAAIAPIVTGSSAAGSTTSATPSPAGPATSSLLALPALLHTLPQVLQRRYDRPRRARQPLHPPGHRHGGPAGRRGRLALPRRRVGPCGATTACSSPSPRSRTGSRTGGKRRRGRSGPSTSTGHSPTSRASSPPTSCMTARSASSRSSTTAPSSGSPTRSWTAHPTAKDVAAFFRRFQAALEARGLDASRGSPPTARRCTPSRSPRSSASPPSGLHVPRPS